MTNKTLIILSPQLNSYNSVQYGQRANLYIKDIRSINYENEK